MSVIVAAVLPVFALLILGHVARRTGFLELAFWSQVEKGTYFVLFPALLVLRLVQAEMDLASTGMVMLGAVLTPLTGGLLAYLARPFLQLDGPDFTSLFQGSARFNTYVGLALAATLPAPALMLAALVLAIMIPLVNVLCVLVFAREVHQGGGLRNVVLSILKNPLILGCLCGIALNLSGLQLPALVLEVLGKLAVMALPLGLLAVGAYVEVETMRLSTETYAVKLETQVPPGAGVHNHGGEIESNQLQAAMQQQSTATTWTIGGQSFLVTPATDLNDGNGALTVGNSAIVNSYTNADGQEVATQIRGIVFTTQLYVPLIVR